MEQSFHLAYPEKDAQCTYNTYIYIVTIKFEVNDKPSYWKNDLSATQFLLYYSVYVIFQIILSTHKNKLLQ